MSNLIPEQPLQKQQRVHLLVVDDNPTNSSLMRDYFKPLAIEIDVAHNGYEALECIKTKAYHLIFMDVNMPGLNGPETTGLLRATMPRQARIPVVALTAHAVEQQKIQLLEAGMDDYISKPARFEAIVALLEKWLTPSALAAAGIGGAAIKQQEMPAAAVITPQQMGLSVVRIDECLRIARHNAPLAVDLLQQFLNSLPNAALQMNKTFQAQNWPALKDEVHRFYGGCCYVGVPALQAATQALNNSLSPPYHSVFSALSLWNEAVQSLQAWAQEHDIAALFEAL